MTMLTAKQASEMLNVSVATVRNWVKHGYLAPVGGAKRNFSENDVLALKGKIARGDITRLRTRANKRSSAHSFVPAEYVGQAEFMAQLETIRNLFVEQQLDLEISLFVLVLKQLVLTAEVCPSDDENPLKIGSFYGWQRRCVQKEIFSWAEKLAIANASVNPNYQTLYQAFTDTAHDDKAHVDTLGVIYQSLLKEGEKSTQGSYYTPRELVDAIFAPRGAQTEKYLDPCCGTGQFLLGAIRAGYANPVLLYGYDVDEIAVRIARINLLLAFPHKEFSPQIYVANTLTEGPTGPLPCETFHLIATNPPWGSALKEEVDHGAASLSPAITSSESFALFLAKSVDLCAAQGCISFVLPESILNVRAHADIRHFLLKNTTITAIHHLGRKFKGVFTPVIRLDLRKGTAPAGALVEVALENAPPYKIPQARFSENDHYIFDIALTNDEAEILALLYAKPHVTLKNHADWALGIVTGDNQKYVSKEKLSGMEPLYKGRDVVKYRLKKPRSYIAFRPERFQQVAPEQKYRVPEKLIYKFISNTLVFAYDRTGALTLNSANILLPKVPNYPIKILLALLNSQLYQFVFAKKFNTHKILRGDLEKLPFPLLTKEEKVEIAQLVERAINGEDVQDKLDFEIMQILGLSTCQMQFVMEHGKRRS